MNIRDRLLAAFRVESSDHLVTMRAILDGWDESLSGSGIAQLDEIFRRAHSMKGAARAVDLPDVEKLSHHLETLLARIRSGRIPLDQAMRVLLGRALDSLEDLAGAGLDGLPSPDHADILAALTLAADPAPAPLPDNPVPIAPPSAVVAPAPLIFDKIPEPAPLPSAPPVGGDDLVRVSAARLDRILESSNELLTGALDQKGLSDDLTDLVRGMNKLAQIWQSLRPALAPGGGRHSRQGDVMDQQIRAMHRRVRQIRRRQQRVGWNFQQLSGALQEQVREARMVPADTVFAAFRKMVRDIARETGRDVDVRVTGLEAQADRVVLQGLKDPVMHLLRNALAHGIEDAATRRAAGKAPAGRLDLGFCVVDGQLTVTVEDDGRGLDYSAIAAKAVDTGLLDPALADGASPSTLQDLIFDPGFSTRDGADDLAGRGMGLSVVRQAVTAMNGAVQVENKRPGCRFTLTVPLSVSTQRLFLVSCQGHVYGIPTQGIDRLYRIAADQVREVEGTAIISIDERQIPLLTFAGLLGLDDPSVKVSHNILPLLVLKRGERRVAVACDQFLSIRDSMVRDIGLPGLRGGMVAGGTIMEDGRVALVLNPFEIVEKFRRQGASRPLETAERPPEIRPPTILVVDDSLTTRTLEKSILEARGFVVRLAVDGLEALARLRAEHVDLVISDIQMPKLDGFGLLRAIKQDPKLKSIPLILVSSLESREDREMGLTLGADAYVVKRKFDQTELLETIGQLL